MRSHIQYAFDHPWWMSVWMMPQRFKGSLLATKFVTWRDVMAITQLLLCIYDMCKSSHKFWWKHYSYLNYLRMPIIWIFKDMKTSAPTHVWGRYKLEFPICAGYYNTVLHIDGLVHERRNSVLTHWINVSLALTHGSNMAMPRITCRLWIHKSHFIHNALEPLLQTWNIPIPNMNR